MQSRKLRNLLHLPTHPYMYQCHRNIIVLPHMRENNTNRHTRHCSILDLLRRNFHILRSDSDRSSHPSRLLHLQICSIGCLFRSQKFRNIRHCNRLLDLLHLVRMLHHNLRNSRHQPMCFCIRHRSSLGRDRMGESN